VEAAASEGDTAVEEVTAATELEPSGEAAQPDPEPDPELVVEATSEPATEE
jgi:hypothetical protein